MLCACRLAPFHSMAGALQLFSLNGIVTEYDRYDELIDDSNDPADPTVFVAPREKRFGGLLVTRVLTAFCAAGGPEAVVGRIACDPIVTRTPIPMPVMQVCVCLFVRVHC